MWPRAWYEIVHYECWLKFLWDCKRLHGGGRGGVVSAERALVFFNNRPTLEVITKSK